MEGVYSSENLVHYRVPVHKTCSLKTCMNEISRNLVNYFLAAPQVTLHTLHCNLLIVLPKPKHAATHLKYSNYFN